jgi:hypothetical protein
VVEQVAVPFCTRTIPFVETQRSGAAAASETAASATADTPTNVKETRNPIVIPPVNSTTIAPN